MTRLSVNVNKVATLRNSRGKNLPDVVFVAEEVLRFGAHGITVHPRPDGRHIRRPDVEALTEVIRAWNESSGRQVEFNVEGYPSEDFLGLMEKVRPHQVTLVPDPPDVLTSNAGWDVAGSESLLNSVIPRLRSIDARVSLFIDPFLMDEEQWQALARCKPDRIELYTERYADCYGTDMQSAVLERYRQVAQRAKDLNIGVNAGHDLNQNNLKLLITTIPWIDEVSIGHALICEALMSGLKNTVEAYLRILKECQVGHSHPSSP